MSTVFLTDGQQRKTLAAARSLGKQGIKVMIGENTRWATAAFSRYCRERVVYPDPVRDPEGFWQKLKEVMIHHQAQTVFPMDDQVLRIVIDRQKELSHSCRLLLPDTEDYKIASDKGLAAEQARQLSIDCPLTLQPKSDYELKSIAQQFDKLKGMPLIIKPRISSGSRGIGYVMAGTNADVFQKAYAQVHQSYPWPLIQECIPSGLKHDVCLLYDHCSNLKAAFVQKEIRHFPLDRGPSTLQESVWRPDLIEKADTLMKSLNWKGIAEVEFMHDARDGKDKFMEINPRFWGSLQLAILSGVDFPWLYYRLIMGQAFSEVTSYQVGVKCRWLLPGDILHFMTNKDRWQMQPSFFAGKRQRVYDDILSREDMMPVLGLIMAVLYYLPKREMWKKLLDR